METLLQDLRFGAKLLLKEKILTATVLATLAVCIGANTALYSVIDAVLLDPLPYPNSDRLVRVMNSYPGAGFERGSTSAPDFFYRRERIDAFEEVAQYQYWGHTVGEPGNTQRVQSLRVTPSLLPMLGVQPILGRTFFEEEMDPDNEQKVLLSYGFWQERYGGDPAVLGTDLRIDGKPYQIVGVLPNDFRFLGERENRLFVPIPYPLDQRGPDNLHSNNYEMLARLAPGATAERAASEIAALDAALVPEVPIPNFEQMLKDTGYRARVLPLKADLVRDVEPVFMLLWAGVGFVLLIGCVNIANLMLAYSNVRMRELATRLALGADRVRLARQLITEAVLMAGVGGTLGLGLGAAGLQVLGAFGVDQLPRGGQVAITGDVVLFTGLLALAAGVFFGLIPLLHLFRSDLSGVFRAGGRTGTASRRAVLLRSGLVTGQVGLAFVLLIGAGLMFASFRSALNVDPGFDPSQVLTGYVSLPDSRYPDADSRRQFYRRLLPELRALPGVEVAGLTTQIPLSDSRSASVILPEGYTPEPGESVVSPFRTMVSPGYFQAMRIPVLAGRAFRESDTEDATRVMLIDQVLADRYWPNESPIGRRMLQGVPGMPDLSEDDYCTIVGVVGAIKQTSLTEEQHVGATYFPHLQEPPTTATLTIRTARAPLALTGAVRRIVMELDPDLPFYLPRTMESRVGESLQDRRSPMLLLGIFAGVALFLAAVGIYGALAYSVTQRTREMGIRMALGSSPGKVFRRVVRQGLVVVAAGLGLGLLGSIVLVRLIQGLLFGVQPGNPMVLAGVALILGTVGVVATVLPARRATRIDPMEALATE